MKKMKKMYRARNMLLYVFFICISIFVQKCVGVQKNEGEEEAIMTITLKEYEENKDLKQRYKISLSIIEEQKIELEKRQATIEAKNTALEGLKKKLQKNEATIKALNIALEKHKKKLELQERDIEVDRAELKAQKRKIAEQDKRLEKYINDLQTHELRHATTLKIVENLEYAIESIKKNPTQQPLVMEDAQKGKKYVEKNTILAGIGGGLLGGVFSAAYFFIKNLK